MSEANKIKELIDLGMMNGNISNEELVEIIKHAGAYGNIMSVAEYAKHVIEINLCTGKPSEFHKLTIADLRETNQVVNLMVDYVNSQLCLTAKYKVSTLCTNV